MPQEINQCPLCLSDKNSLFDQRQFREHQVVNCICENCGLVFQSPRMTADELDAFYAREYRQVYQGEEGPTKKDLFVQNGRADALMEILAQQQVTPTRYLDIGCSSGILLQRFRDHFGCEAIGIEPGDAYRNHAQKQGLTVYADISDLEDTEKPDFDLISMAHVLEHLPDPVGYLADMRKDYLTPSGWLLIEVPNLFSHDSFEIAHMTSFSAHSLGQVLDKAGFQIVVLKQHGHPRSRILPLYLTVLAKPREHGQVRFQVKPERNVALKRRFGLLWRRILQKLFPHKAWVPIK
ncbi:MAG: class I SAM-dependent methyltransferase [Anaerolineales bacterium]|nr:class I SAM-dependent methyltransferase [Chloroflexota bacterium]MBL6979865.1 class I SAM-dependent methyltransferase [Anaerolineales bacterium]